MPATPSTPAPVPAAGTPAHPPAPTDRGSLTARVSDWYQRNARDLPWRHPDASPWAVLVSEVMLQQTPVSRVLPAWHAWLERWPTPADLAVAPVAEAIRMWGRLGYPRRAVRLHECATVLVERYDGQVPSDLTALLSLPGIGSYTARAVAVFAFRDRHPVVDTNVRRVVARAVEGLADAGPSTSAAELIAVDALLPTEPEPAAVASIALMELGALVCTARNPACDRCPLAADCAWLQSGSPPLTGPSRRPQRYAGTDRQVRGLLLAVLREADAPVPKEQLDVVWSDPVQRERALAALVTDGLAHRLPDERWTLPTSH